MGGRLRTAPRAGLLVAAVFVTLAGVVAQPGPQPIAVLGLRL